jgi:hypothetical protein
MIKYMAHFNDIEKIPDKLSRFEYAEKVTICIGVIFIFGAIFSIFN